MATRPKVLIVDDEANIRLLLEAMLKRLGCAPSAVATAEEALALLEKPGWDLLVSDLRLPGMHGRDLVAAAKRRWPELPVLVISGYGATQDVVAVIRSGAEDYLAKPFKQEELEVAVLKALEKRRLLLENRRLRREVEGEEGLEGLLGRSPAMLALFEALRRTGPSGAHVLLLGESGTGKELAGKAIHRLSARAQRPYVQVNLAALPSTLMEAELFGCRKGAFTGADEDREGLFQAADNGTLFLDEVGEAPLEVQAKLLRVLEGGEVRRLGDSKVRKVDVRVVAATHRDLEAMVRGGQFRRDLFYRLAVLPIHLPPLRRRGADIALLAEAFLARQANARSLSPAALKVLSGYAWPGNVRELKNVLERAALMAAGPLIQPEDLVFLGAAEAGAGRDLSDFASAKKESVKAFEQAYLRQALNQARGNVSEAARATGLARQNLQALLKKHALKPADFKASKHDSA